LVEGGGMVWGGGGCGGVVGGEKRGGGEFLGKKIRKGERSCWAFYLKCGTTFGQKEGNVDEIERRERSWVKFRGGHKKSRLRKDVPKIGSLVKRDTRKREVYKSKAEDDKSICLDKWEGKRVHQEVERKGPRNRAL